MVALSNKIYEFQTRPEFADKKKGIFLDLVIYSIPFAILHSVSVISHSFSIIAGIWKWILGSKPIISVSIGILIQFPRGVEVIH